MSVWAALLGGLVGTTVLTTIMRAASELGLTRMDVPLLLGTALTEDRRRAKAIGYLLHAMFGLLFSLLYFLVFMALGVASAALGALLSLVHVLFVGTAGLNVILPLVHPLMGSDETGADQSPHLEPPGFMLLNYGPWSPVVAMAGHLLYGAIVGYFASRGNWV